MGCELFENFIWIAQFFLYAIHLSTHHQEQASLEYCTNLWRFKTRHPRRKVSNNLFGGIKPPSIHLIPHLQSSYNITLTILRTRAGLSVRESYLYTLHLQRIPTQPSPMKDPFFAQGPSHRVFPVAKRNPPLQLFLAKYKLSR